MSVATSMYEIASCAPSTNRPVGVSQSRRSSRIFEKSQEKRVLISRKRRSARGSSSLWDLARFVKEGKQVVFVTGAGLSVPSGVRQFRTTNASNSKYSSDCMRKYNLSSRMATSSEPVGTAKRQKKLESSKKGLVEEQPLGIWNSVLWTQAKRETFRKDPLMWWNHFWLRYFPVEDYENRYAPNVGHLALAALQRSFPDTIKVITQNVDGLQHAAIDQEERNPVAATELKKNIIEAHGRLGLYKCVPVDDSDTDSSSDEDDDRLVHLGHRRKYRAWKRRHQSDLIARKKRSVVGTDLSSSSSSTSRCMSSNPTCEYQMLKSLRVDQLAPVAVRRDLTPKRANPRSAADCDKNDEQGPRLLKNTPRCPSCGNAVLPQALLFDEGYHSHEHYNFIKIEEWIAKAEVLVFIGTSFAVTLPLVALDYAREVGIPVFNFNISDMVSSTARLHAENIAGPSQETLPKLWEAVQQFEHHENLSCVSQKPSGFR